MTTRVFVSAVVRAPIETVWARVRDFNGLPDWHPRFSRSHIEGGEPADRIGCIRNFDIAGGGTIREKLLSLSDEEHSFTYCILDSPLPVEGYVAGLRLWPVTADNTTFGVWTAQFRVISGSEAEVVDTVGRGTFGKAFEVLDALLAGRG